MYTSVYVKYILFLNSSMQLFTQLVVICHPWFQTDNVSLEISVLCSKYVHVVIWCGGGNNWQLDLAGVFYVRMCLYLSNIAGDALPPIKSSYICCAACKNVTQTHIYLKISPFAHRCCGIASWGNSIPDQSNWIMLRVIPSLHVCLFPFWCIVVVITWRKNTAAFCEQPV